ncbi:MAG: ATP-binding protein [Cyclobacteriaceae bacterium]|jgi:signal transduction histidine kinase/CheY-like chemotaxis protein|nr:ATP-binding protein [Cyclobacteriaceae bacterium]
MGRPSSRQFLHSARNKIIAAFLLAVVAVSLAVGTTYLSFDTLLTKVDELSAPNEKLIRLNNLFEQITTLDQRQRADVLRNPVRAQSALAGQSNQIMASIDSLLAEPWETKQQVQRLQTVRRIFAKRNFYLSEYITIQRAVISKQNQRQLDSLADLLVNAVPPPDTSVTTTQRKTTTTTYLGEPEKKANFFSRLFGSKKKDGSEAPASEVKEEVNTRIDTLAIHRSDTTIQQLTRLMKSLEATQQQQSKRLLQRELELANANMVLMTQVLSILRDLEAEEIQAAQRNNAESLLLVKSSTRTIGAIMIVFFLMAAILVFLILTDISRSNFYRIKLEEAKKEAERLGQIKQRFLSNMSHEIRTPLQSIIGFSEQLANPSDHSAKAIRHASLHLLQIVNEVLDFSRLESDTLRLENAPFSLPHLVREVSHAGEVLANQKNIVFRSTPHHLPDFPVMGDAFRLKQVLYNLLSNAIKFTEKGSVVLEAHAQVDLMVTCQFTVTDTGIGMTPEEQAKIFSEFEQAHAGIAERFGGSGLGLSIVKKLVDLFHGEIRVASEPGQGSTFTIQLAFERAPAEAKPATTALAAPARQGGTVAVVDDDALIIRLCETIFKKHHIPFCVFRDAQELERADVSHVSVALIDIRMPGMPGTEVAKRFRQKAPAARLIAFTAHALPEEQRALRSHDFDDLLLKPFLEADLLRTVGMVSPSVASQPLSALRTILGDDEALIDSVVAEFRSDTEADLRLLKTKPSDAVWREVIHRLAGRTGQMGFADMHRQLVQAEHHLAAGMPLTAPEQQRLVADITALIDSLRTPAKN